MLKMLKIAKKKKKNSDNTRVALQVRDQTIKENLCCVCCFKGLEFKNNLKN